MTLSLGIEWQRKLCGSLYRLRLDLSDGDYVGRYVTKFTNSFDRAHAISREALPTEPVVGIVAALPEPSLIAGAEWLDWTTGSAFEHLARLGVSTDAAFATWTGYWWPEDEDNPEMESWEHRAVILT